MAKYDKKTGEEIRPFGYELDDNWGIIRPKVRLRAGDYGCDPLGDNRFRMVPSGDIVDYDEMKRRLQS